MINVLNEIEKVKEEGYNEANAEARICQDIILCGIANSTFNRNVTIKGGVVMRNLSKDARRATQDIDLDFLKYSISDDAIKLFISRIQPGDGIALELMELIIELRHKDYRGKRVFIKIIDAEGNELESKIDIGVHKDLDILQEEYCFDICFQQDSAGLLMNSCEQIFTEKLKSFLRFGTRSTRYKDIFDIFYLSSRVNSKKLNQCIQRFIYEDNTLSVNTPEDIISRMTAVLINERFLQSVKKSKKNWTDVPTEEVFKKCLEFIHTLAL